ncbi:LysR family transcriptional regulator [Nonomuraea sp. NPDC049709]|uniref:LysR family transcriptional regulator n=1 Tax=Nonomuraea sp. NPDC049709 TaxID=3154736 RepID=UPI003412E891
MDVRQLEYFLAVVDHGGFDKGAKALSMAQPSLSQAIRTLEKDLGSQLFHRIGRRVVLTEAGRALIEPARQVVRSLAAARASVAAVHGMVCGSVAIASMPSPAAEPLSSMIDHFRDRHPGVEVAIAVESEHREAFLPLVLKGVGIGVPAEAWRTLAERAGALVFDLDPPASLHLALVSRKGWLSPAAAEFLEIATSYRRGL